MARYLAVDWDQHEVRLVWASSTAGRLGILALASVPVAATEKEGQRPHIGQTLRRLLAAKGIGRPTTLVALDWARVEALELNLPPAKNDELPELVQLQAMRQSPSIAEESAIDFISLTSDPTQPRKVLAVAASVEQMNRIQEVCSIAGLKPRRVVVRSFGLASLFARTAAAPERCVMLVDQIGEDADLVVVVDGRATYQRTIRLPDAPDEGKAADRLVTEIRRTAAVAVDDSVPDGIECVYLVGREEEQEPLAARIRAETGLAVKVFDPLRAMGVPDRIRPDRPQCFAPLLGILLDEVRGAAHPLDFLNPRRPTPRADRRRPLVLAIVAALVAVFMGAYFVWDNLALADAENHDLERQLRELKAGVKKAGDRNKVVDAIHEWLGGDVNWLDELRDLSIRFPTARDMIVLRMNITSSPRAGGGDVTLQGVVRDPLVVARMENNLRDKHHEVSSKRVQERVRDKTYAWHFETSISVSKRDKAHYTSHLPRSAAEKEKEQEAAAPTGSAEQTQPAPSDKPATGDKAPAETKPAASEPSKTTTSEPAKATTSEKSSPTAASPGGQP